MSSVDFADRFERQIKARMAQEILRIARANNIEHLIQSRLLHPFGLARIEDAETEHLEHMQDWVWKLSVGECAYGSLGLPSERLIAVMGNTTNADKLGNITCQ